MKIYSIGFTKNAVQVLEGLKEVANKHGDEVYRHLSPRVFEALGKELPPDYQPASLATFTKTAWQEADVLVFVGAMGIAVRAIAACVHRKDLDPAVLVIDEQAQFVIPILSGHIGGGNAYANLLAEGLAAVPVLTTATDLNKKFAVDSWAVQQGHSLHSTKNIAQVSSAILEDRPVLLFAPQEICQILAEAYNQFICFPMAEDWQEGALQEEVWLAEKVKTGHPVLVFSPRAFVREEEVLHIIPQVFFAGMGARKNADPAAVEEFYRASLAEHCIHPKSIRSISSIDIKKEEEALHHVAGLIYRKGQNSQNQGAGNRLNFFTAEELQTAERYTDHIFAESDLVKSVTGVGTVCERAAILGAVQEAQEDSDQTIRVAIIVPKCKGGGATLAISRVEGKK